MATNTKGNFTREGARQHTNYLRKRVNFNDTGISTGIPFDEYLPAGARIIRTQVFIKTTFNATTTNVLTVGQNSSSYNDIVAAADVDESVAGAYSTDRGANLDLDSADALPYVKYTQTGTAATQGVADVVIEYVPNNG